MTDEVISAVQGMGEIRRLALERDATSEGLNVVTLLLELIDPGDRSRGVTVRFFNVFGLSFVPTTSNLTIAPQIASIADRGWEKGRYHFTVPGDGSLGFYFDEAELVHDGDHVSRE